MISEKEVEHIAGLARLKLSGHEKEKFQKELSLILDYFAQLKELDVESVVPTTSSSGANNVMRNDQAEASDPSRIKSMLEQVPDSKSGFVKVKAILSK